MKKDSKTTLQVGNQTDEATPVAAIIQIDGSYGIESLFFKGENADSILEQLYEYQDLFCLCRMARTMGTNEDAKIASDLEDFITSPYEIEDFDDFNFDFSIGCIKCIAWTKGLQNIQLLESQYEEQKR